MIHRRHEGSCTQEPRPSDRVGELRELASSSSRYVAELLHHSHQPHLDDMELPHEATLSPLHSRLGVADRESPLSTLLPCEVVTLVGGSVKESSVRELVQGKYQVSRSRCKKVCRQAPRRVTK